MDAKGARVAGRTFTEEARRAQIVQAAIETVAELGYPNASFSKIAQRAGLSSTGMISYYFAGKAELLAETMATVLRTAAEFVGPRVEQEQTQRGKLRAYILANLAFMVAHPHHTPALVEVITGTRYQEGGSPGAAAEVATSDRALVDCLTRGQEAGEFGDFEPAVMAVAVRGAIDNTVRQYMINPDIRLDDYGRQLADIFDHATRPA